MDKIPRLTAGQRDNLVAYLDGELDEDATREIEQILSKSPVARHEVEMLTRTWEMLDILPPTHATQDFTQRTMATLQVSELREPAVPDAAKAWLAAARRWMIVGACAAGLAAAAAVGFLTTYRWAPNESDMLVRDFPVIDKLDLYRDVQQIEFLKQLHESGVLREETEPGDF